MALAEVSRDAAPLQQLLVGRSGFLMGLEAPPQIDTNQSEVWDGSESWGSSERAPSYATLQKQAAGSDWLVRSIESLPDGQLVIRRDDLKKVPPRVGPAWLRCQLHVQDLRWARKELEVMLQRYLAARMFTQGLDRPFGAFLCACSNTALDESELGPNGSIAAEMGVAELTEVLGNGKLIFGALTPGEVGPPGIAMGGSGRKRTTRQGHTVSFCLFSYEPTTNDVASSDGAS